MSNFVMLAYQQLLKDCEDGNLEKVKRMLAPRRLFIFKNNINVNVLITPKGKYGSQGSTLLHGATSGGSKEIVELVIARGADVNAITPGGRVTPLHIASLMGKKDIVELLIAKGANVNAAEMNGLTSLHLAADSGRKEIVELLIAAGADLNASDNKGKTPLDMASSHKEIVELLRANKDSVSPVKPQALGTTTQSMPAPDNVGKEKIPMTKGENTNSIKRVFGLFGLFRTPDVAALKSKGDVRGLAKALRYKKNSAVQKAAISALSDIGGDAVVEPLITVFKDDNLPVRWYAVDALGRIGKPAMKALLLAIRGEVGGETVRPIVLNMRARSFVEQTLIHLGANAVGPLIEILTNGTQINQNVANALAAIGDSRAVAPFVQLLANGADVQRSVAARALGELKAAGAVQPLIVALQDRSQFVRECAARALGQIGDTRALGPLTSIRNDSNEEVRAEVASALAVLGAGAGV